jgi:hypothetical protein
MLSVQRYNGLAYVSVERQGAIFMKSNGEKPSYALDPLIVRDWELKANGIRLEELLAAYAKLQGGDMQALEWFTATNTMIGIAYIYGLQPPITRTWIQRARGKASIFIGSSFPGCTWRQNVQIRFGSKQGWRQCKA